MEDLVNRIRRGQYGFITSLLVVRDSNLVVEEYFNGWLAPVAHTAQSVTKSVTSLLVGLAMQSGRLRLEDRVTDFFPEYRPLLNNDANKSALTVGDLLTMRSGFDWDESVYAGSPLQRMNECRCDWVRFVLDWPLRAAPGSRWDYISGGTILLGAVVGAATSSRLDLFASARLFGPLQTQDENWFHGLPSGLPHAGGGLNIRPRDMAKLGVLVETDGRWRGQQVVDAAWMRASTARLTPAVRVWAGRSFDYASGWWVTNYAGTDVVAASGSGGQWIFVVRPLGLVVVATGNNDDGRWVSAVEFLFSHILPSVRP
jgi:CubicO group peptidase (beta-lactamase class C family)